MTNVSNRRFISSTLVVFLLFLFAYLKYSATSIARGKEAVGLTFTPFSAHRYM